MERDRLTITLRRDVLEQLDRTIDGYKLRNRSHAIEYYLSRELGGRLTKALILCGGTGVHLRPFTYELPKAMIPVKGRPILEHIIGELRDQGVRDVILTIDYLGEKIQQHFGDGAKFGVKFTYVPSAKPIGTGGSLRAAKSAIGDQPFLLLYGDVLAKVDYHDLIDFHAEQKKLVTMAVTSVADPSASGVVGLRGARIVSFTEKPNAGPATSRLISAGIFVMDPTVIDAIPAKAGVVSLERDVFPTLVKRDSINGFVIDAPWYDISTPETYERALKEWRE
jgi:NDP-sugar pyrophosphorylase family protein